MKIADLHEDIAYAIKTGGFQPELNENLFYDLDKDVQGRHADLPKYAKGNIKLIFGAIFPGIKTISEYENKRIKELYGNIKESSTFNIGNFEEIIDQILVYRLLIKRYSHILMSIKNINDTSILESNDKIGILMSLEGSDALKKPEDIEILHLLGVRCVAINWNYDNRFASSCISRKDFGLTQVGENLVELSNELGIIIDVSHSSKNTTLDICNISKLPIIASHSNYYSIQKHKRNLDDDMLEAIKKTNGVVGFTFIPSTIGKNPTLKELSKHIVAVEERFGPDILAIGSDFFGINSTPVGLEDISKISNLIEYLKEEGFNDSKIVKICWKNVIRVIRSHENRWKDRLSVS